MEKYKIEVIGIKKFSEGSFILKTKKPKAFNFKAGQFVMIHYKNNKKAFSISSHPSNKTLYFLIKKHNKGAVTPFLYNLKKGDKIEISGPFGAFTIKDLSSKEIIFIAAGTGISPFRGMILEALKRFPNKKINLIFGFRQDFYYKDFFDKLKEKNKNFNYHAFCTGNIKDWKGKKGRVTEHMPKIIISPNNKEAFICGPKEMAESTKNTLIKIGFKLDQIHMEKW
ncbi:MAG: FAD-dependent oxidoreductase [Candidatus Woesearchaeota archaeon]